MYARVHDIEHFLVIFLLISGCPAPLRVTNILGLPIEIGQVLVIVKVNEGSAIVDAEKSCLRWHPVLASDLVFIFVELDIIVT